MKVYEIFDKIDKDKFAEILVERYNRYYDTKEKALEHLEIFLQDAHKQPFEPLTKEEIDNGFVLQVMETYSDEETEPLKNEQGDFYAPQVDFDKVPKYMYVDGINLKELVEKRNYIGLTCKEYKEKDVMPPVTYGIDFTPKRKTFNYDVIGTSIDKYGLETVAVELFFELTFYGLYDEDIDEEGDKLLESKKEIDKVNDYAKENNISYSEASEQLGFGKTVSFDEFTQEMIENEEQKDDEESKEFVNWLKETSTNKTYTPALLAINEQFANKNREYEKQFYDEFFEKYKDDELLKKFL